MMDLFIKLSPHIQILTLAIFSILSTSVLLFLKWLFLKLISSLTNGKIKWSIHIKSKDSPSDTIKQSNKNITESMTINRNHGHDHASCPIVTDVIMLLHNQQIMLGRVFHIKDHDILSDQMAYAENKVDMITSADEVNFSALLKATGKADYLYSEEYIAYRALAEFKKEKILSRFRHMCKENHFTDKSEEDFAEYVRNNVTIVTDLLIKLSKDFFPFYLSLPGYASFVETANTKMNAYILDILYNAREVTITANNRIESLLNEFENEYEKKIGVPSTRISL